MQRVVCWEAVEKARPWSSQLVHNNSCSATLKQWQVVDSNTLLPVTVMEVAPTVEVGLASIGVTAGFEPASVCITDDRHALACLTYRGMSCEG